MRYIAFLVLILFAGTAFVQPKLKKVNLSKEISIALPKDFSAMSDDDIAREYPATTRPLAAYTGPNGQIDFSVTQKPAQFRAQDLNMLREFYKASLLEKFTKVDFIRDEVTEIKGQDFIVFEFVSSVADERGASNLGPVNKYSIVQYTIKDGKMLIFTMHVPYMLRNEWQEPAREIMSSVKLK
ncbi:hypothetical protein CLV24_114117 [Pontibacter ummariensis]|uniref:DUF1795 domain-containing protein n=1 Tax=Pontibacter ummariensis TaxID=1610492 RepID=A0A239HTW7_9BACT|nr:hypothetical protein [Pontibacter ummariensis]PRY10388.1 hypothetical protein CLV24_114117 [Pontibacter ummariensis]SNS83664.1 hypothetical protein SAMN06296052_114117 [Pontibacter ummariensis]